MRAIGLIFVSVAALLVGCVATAPAPSSQYEAYLGKEIYVLVMKKFDVPEQDILRSEACAKRDALCGAMLNSAREMEYATVAVHSNIAIQKVFVPRTESIQPGDIIRIRIATDVRKVPMFVALGSRARDRLFKRCDWIDGNPLLGVGGVACNGWSYKDAKEL